MTLTEKQLEYIEGEIKPVYIENTIAWALNNLDIKTSSDIPLIFGGVAANPAQQVFEEAIIALIGGENV